MKCMCAGPYPSIEQQAATLRNEPDMPKHPMHWYVFVVERVNSMLFANYMRFIQRLKRP